MSCPRRERCRLPDPPVRVVLGHVSECRYRPLADLPQVREAPCRLPSSRRVHAPQGNEVGLRSRSFSTAVICPTRLGPASSDSSALASNRNESCTGSNGARFLAMPDRYHSAPPDAPGRRSAASTRLGREQRRFRLPPCKALAEKSPSRDTVTLSVPASVSFSALTVTLPPFAVRVLGVTPTTDCADELVWMSP